MTKSISTHKLLRIVAVYSLVIAGLANPARSGEVGAVSATTANHATGAPALMTGALAPGHWFAGPLRGVVEGAARRLASSSCQAVLQDFADSRGRPLQEKLNQLGLTAPDYVRAVRFYPGFDEPACKERGRVFAFTVPGSLVVRICRPLPRLSISDPELAQAIVIHEILHTLGLGENPPSSTEITSRVRGRCFAAH